MKIDREEVLGKTVVRHKKKIKKDKIPDKELHHPLHQPYKREPKVWLRNSLMIDGLGEEDELDQD